MSKHNANKYFLKILWVFLLAIFVFFISLSNGTIKVGFVEVINSLLGRASGANSLIVLHTRLSRIVIGALVGINLSLSGAILQGIMRNQLAGPSIIGVTSGASFAGHVTLILFPGLFHLLPIGAILGAILTTFIIYSLAYDEGVNPVRLILSGVAISGVFSAFSNIIKSFYPERVGDAVGFFVGSLNGVNWSDLSNILPYTIIGVLMCIILADSLNIILLGDEIANSLGVRTERVRLLAIIAANILAGSSIAVAGLFSFVGLMVPHIARLLVGSDYRFLFPMSALLGATLVMVSDFIGRMILPIGEISASIIISFVGAPFFLYLLKKRYKTEGI